MERNSGEMDNDFMEGQGVGGHVGDEFSPSLFFFLRGSQMVSKQCDSRAVL